MSASEPLWVAARAALFVDALRSYPADAGAQREGELLLVALLLHDLQADLPLFCWVS